MVFIWFLALCLFAITTTACTAVSPTTPEYTATTGNDQDHITFNPTENTLFIDIASPTGIGDAFITSQSGVWPQQVILRLHLQGLEQFDFTYGNTTVTAALSSYGDQEVRESTQVGSGDPQPLSGGGVYWMDIQLAANSGETAVVPIKNGTINITAPQDFLKSGSQSFFISWIDFFR